MNTGRLGIVSPITVCIAALPGGGTIGILVGCGGCGSGGGCSRHSAND